MIRLLLNIKNLARLGRWVPLASVVAGLGVAIVGCGGSAGTQMLPSAPHQGSLPLLVAAATTSSYKATVLADSPAAYYRLDETSGTVVIDSSGHGKTGTITGTASFGLTGALSGDPDAGMGFNGTNTAVSASLAAMGSHYSLEAWIKTGFTVGEIISVSPQQLIFQGGRLKFGTGGHYLWSSSSSYDDNQYHHIVATYDGVTKVLYVDGAQVGSVTDSSAGVSGSTLTVGNFYGGGGFFTGSIDEVAIYNTTLSAIQVQTHFNVAHASASPGPSATPTPMPSPSSGSNYRSIILADSPLAYYRLDEAAGTSATDSSGHGRTGSITGSPSYAVAGALNGDADTAMGFNGTNTAISASIPSLGTSYTLEAWVKTGFTAGQIISASPQQLVFQGGQFKFGTGGHYIWSPSAAYGDNQYHYVAATYDGSIKRLYVDGSEVASASDSVGWVNGTTLYVGAFYGGGGNFQGSIDEVSLYSYALSVAKIQAHFNAGHSSVATPTPGPSSTPTVTPSPSPTATSIASIPKHVLSSDYTGGPNDTALAAARLAPWLSWTETSWQANPSFRSAGVKVMYYTDPNRQLPGGPMYTSDEATFAHTCSGARIKSTNYGQYLMDPASSSMRSLWADWIAQRSVNVTWDAIFEDDTDDVNAVTAMPCGYTSATWLAASAAEELAQSSTPIVYNGLQINGQLALNASANVVGGMEEGCYSGSASFPKMWDSYWVQLENTEIAMAEQGKVFFCLGNDGTSAVSSTDGRMYTYASFLLTYNPSSSVLWENYGTASNFRVEPESKLVALNPLVSQPSDIGALQLSTGVYGREYASCYIAGVPVGPCAAVVNPSRFNTNGYPYGSKYRHTLVLIGGGILDGGSISTSGPPPPSVLSPKEAAIVFQ